MTASRFTSPGTATAPSRFAIAFLLSAIVLVGFVARFYGVWFGMPLIDARPDERTSMDVALSFLHGDLWPESYAYPHLFAYGITLAYLSAAALGHLLGRVEGLGAFLAAWPAHVEPFFLAARAVSAVAGTATIFVTFLLARRRLGVITALVAAWFVSLAFLHVRDSHFATTDVTMTLLVVACSWLSLEAVERASTRWLAAAAVAGGLAMGAKYNAVFLLLPLAVAWWLVRRDASRRSPKGRPGGGWALAVGLLLLFTAAFLSCAPFVVQDPAGCLAVARNLGLATLHGHTGRAPVNGWWYHLSVSLRHGVGLPLLVLGAIGVGLVARLQGKTALLLFAFPAVYFAVAGGMENVFFRYALPLVPFVCVAAAVTVVALGNRLFAAFAGVRSAFIAGLAVLAIVPSAASVVAFDRIVARTDSRVLAAAYVSAHAVDGSSIAQSGPRYGCAQLDWRRFAVWVWNRDQFEVNRRQAKGRPDWILVQESPLPGATQPIIREYLATGYALVTKIDAWDARARDNVYDVQDAFFAPYAGFSKVERPGPNFLVYKRVDAP